jgi:phosphonate transport system substrate-binding protein
MGLPRIKDSAVIGQEVFFMAHRFSLARWLLVPIALLLLEAMACSTAASSPGNNGNNNASNPAASNPVDANSSKPALKVSGIPDQDAARLARRFQMFANYLSEELGTEVEYVPSVNYAAVVTAFTQGDLQLAFFGGLTGVQARLQNPGAQAIAQWEHDARFHSKFIVQSDLPINSLEDLKAHAKELSFTFGSESSTSGHLMPRHFLTEAGINPDTDFKSLPNYSGSHDLTWQLVEGGSFNVGALNEDVWERAVQEGKVDTSKVRVFYTTPDYYDYHWMARPDLNEIYGEGFTGRVQAALLKLNPQEHAEILELFSTERFIETNNSNYQAIEEGARNQGLIR